MTLLIAFVRSHLEYAQVVWSPKMRKLVNTIEQVQGCATRLVEGLKHLAYSERLQILSRLPSVEFRRLQTDMVEIFKHLKIYDLAMVPNRLIRRTRHETRQAVDKISSCCRISPTMECEVQSKSSHYRAILWNIICQEMSLQILQTNSRYV